MNKRATTLLCWALIIGGCVRSRSGDAGMQPRDTASTENTVSNMVSANGNYNIYIDNSGSMDGYIFPGSGFENGVFDIITRLSGNNIADNVSLNFVSDRVCSIYPKATAQEIRQFVYHLDEQKAQSKQRCQSKDSDIPNVIDTVIRQSREDVGVLVSDCILSLDHRSGALLNQQKDMTMDLLAAELRRQDFSTLIFKFSAPFGGVYYSETKQGAGIPLGADKIQRPYYVLIFGKPVKIKALLGKLDFTQVSGFEAAYYLPVPQAISPEAVVIRENKIGNFRIEQPASKLILNNAQADAGVLQFSVAVNLAPVRMDEAYLLNPANYELPPNYSITAITGNKNAADPSLSGFSHIFTIKTTQLAQNQDVTIRLKNQVPAWVAASSGEDDSNPRDTAQQRLTFGLSYLVNGINEAYNAVYKDKNLFVIDVKVSKDNYGSGAGGAGFPWWIVAVLLILVGGIVILRRKK